MSYSVHNFMDGDLILAADVNQMDAQIAANEAALAGKQAALTFDSTPTAGSGNPVTSGGVYTALQSVSPSVGTLDDIPDGSTYKRATAQQLAQIAANETSISALREELDDYVYGGSVTFTRYTITDGGGIAGQNIAVPAGAILVVKLVSSVVDGTADYATKLYAKQPDNPAADSNGIVLLQNPLNVGETYQASVDYATTRVQFAPTPWKATSVEFVIDVGFMTPTQSRYETVEGLVRSKLCRIFTRVGCVGDSYTSGHIQAPDESNAVRTNEAFAWPGYAAKITGQEWLNFGESGATCLNWMERARGLPAAQSAGVCQAYVVGIMINDTSNVTLGTSADMGTNAETYYGGMVRLINALLTISPDAHIFVQTCPRTTSPFPSYNRAVKDIVAYYNNNQVHCLDLVEYKKLYDAVAADYTHGHYTAIGYEFFAEMLCKVLSEYIWDNIEKFQTVYLIPYGSSST